MAPVTKIADVRVSVRPDTLTGEGETAYRANSMSGAIRAALVKELRKGDKLADSGAVIEFCVTDFQLRTGTEVFWIGAIAGSDYLAGTVAIKNGETVIKTFEASAKGSESAWSGMVLGRVSANSRADLFCRMIAKRIVQQL